MKNFFLTILGLILMGIDRFKVNHNAMNKVAGMAIIKMSAIGITAISGKAGGTIFSRNKGGAYAKNFVMPVNTFSEARQAVKALFGAISSGWRSLTDSQRESWREGAVAYPVMNSLGDEKVLTANSLYVGLNNNLANAGLPLIATCLPPQGTNGIIAEPVGAVFDIGTGDEFEFGFTLENNNGVSENEYVLECTPAVQDSIRNVENRFRVLKSTATAGGTTPPSTSLNEQMFYASSAAVRAGYEAKFGEPSVGDVIWFRIKAVNPNTGETSAYWTTQVTVTASA